MLTRLTFRFCLLLFLSTISLSAGVIAIIAPKMRSGWQLAYAVGLDAGHNRLYLYDVSRSVSAHLAQTTGAHFRPYWSPDGNYLIYSIQSLEVKALHIPTGRIINFTNDRLAQRLDLHFFGWSDEGTAAVFNAIDDGVVEMTRLDLETGEWSSIDSRLAPIGIFDGWLNPNDDNSLYYINGDASQVKQMDLTTGEISIVHEWEVITRFSSAPAVSPNGKHFTLSIPDSEFQHHDIFLFDFASGDLQPLSIPGEKNEGRAAWSLSGESLAFVAIERSNVDMALYYFSVGDAEPSLLYQIPATNMSVLRFSPDDEVMSFVLSDRQGMQLCLLKISDASTVSCPLQYPLIYNVAWRP